MSHRGDSKGFGRSDGGRFAQGARGMQSNPMHQSRGRRRRNSQKSGPNPANRQQDQTNAQVSPVLQHVAIQQRVGEFVPLVSASSVHEQPLEKDTVSSSSQPVYRNSNNQTLRELVVARLSQTDEKASEVSELIRESEDSVFVEEPNDSVDIGEPKTDVVVGEQKDSVFVGDERDGELGEKDSGDAVSTLVEEEQTLKDSVSDEKKSVEEEPNQVDDLKKTAIGEEQIETLSVEGKLIEEPTVEESTPILNSSNWRQAPFNEIDKRLFGIFFLQVGEKAFPVNSASFAFQSLVFERLLFSESDEAKTHIIQLDTARVEAVDQFTDYINYGKLGDLDAVAEDLLMLAKQYEVKELEDICQKHLDSKLTDDNVFQRLVDALKRGDEELKKAAVKYLNDPSTAMDFKSILISDEFGKLFHTDSAVAQKIIRVHFE